MRKLRLSLEELRIETFVTDADPVRRGTVQGLSGTTLTEDVTYCIQRCGDPTAEATCPASCGYGECPQTPNTACEM
jgi:hypothetical protein